MNINKNLMEINHTEKKRTKKDICWIVVHYVGALGDAKANTDYYKNNYIDASADFWVGHNGDIWQGNDFYNYYSWHCGGGMQSSEGGKYYGICTNANSIGIEMCVKKKSTSTLNATDTDWYFTDATEKACAELVKYLMKELDIDIYHVIRHYDVTGKYCPNPYLDKYHSGAWNRFKSMISGTAISVKDETEVFYRVRKSWSDAESQIGAYTSMENAKANCPIGYSVFDEKGKSIYTAEIKVGKVVNAKDLNGLSESEKIKMIAQLYQTVMKDTGMLASVGLAQFCLESGYGTTDLAQNANNLHGMKCSLSGNTWTGSHWDGKSIYTKKTQEQDKNGNVYYVTADFRKYSSILDSIYDRAAYFIGATSGSKKRYPNINKITDAVEQINLIKSGGYATDVSYVSKLTSILNRYNLVQYDNVKVDKVEEYINQSKPSKIIYRVQIGFYEDKTKADEYAKKIVKKAKIDCIVKKKNNGYMIQSGSYEIEDNAKNQVELLKKNSYLKKNSITPFYFKDKIQ